MFIFHIVKREAVKLEADSTAIRNSLESANFLLCLKSVSSLKSNIK